MPVLARASRPVFDAENPLYCVPAAPRVSGSLPLKKSLSGPLDSLRGQQPRLARQTSFVRKLLELDSPSNYLMPFTSSQTSLASAPPSQPAVDPALIWPSSFLAAQSPSPLRVKTSHPKRSSNLALKPINAPAPVAPQPFVLSPPPEPARYGMKRKRTSSDFPSLGLDDVSTKRARSSGPVHSSSFFLSSNGPQPHFSTTHESSACGYYIDKDLADLRHTFYTQQERGLEAAMETGEGRCTLPEHLAYAELIVELQEELCGYDPGAECDADIALFVDALNQMLPGLRIKEHLRPISTLSHQDIVDFFGDRGYFNRSTLAMFRAAKFRSISLGPSLSGDDVMVHRNMEETLQVLTRPNSFSHLQEINLNNTPLTPDSLIMLQSLRGSLEELSIKRTGTTNAELPHLVCLKKLGKLYLTGNPGVSDEGATNLLYMTQLTTLELDNTGLTMVGLRRFAYGILTQNRKIELEIPEECDNYMNNLHTQYLVHPSAPLITDPHACGFLSLSALKKNLTEHARYDAEIQVKGTKNDLAPVLRDLLERRRADMQVRAVLWKMDDPQETPQSGDAKRAEEVSTERDEDDDSAEPRYTYSS